VYQPVNGVTEPEGPFPGGRKIYHREIPVKVIEMAEGNFLEETN